jgi:hypothetical protein
VRSGQPVAPEWPSLRHRPQLACGSRGTDVLAVLGRSWGQSLPAHGWGRRNQEHAARGAFLLDRAAQDALVGLCKQGRDFHLVVAQFGLTDADGI